MKLAYAVDPDTYIVHRLDPPVSDQEDGKTACGKETSDLDAWVLYFERPRIFNHDCPVCSPTTEKKGN